MEILTNNFNSDITRMFITDTKNNQDYYMFVSNIGTFAPVDSAISQNEFLENTLFGKKINNDDINYMIKYYPWQRGTVYVQYDDSIDLDGLKFYSVVGPNDNDTGDYRIYKCLANGDGTSAQSPPTYDAANVTQIYETADGYIWKYMYRLTTLQFEAYNALGYIPIDPNANFSPAVVDGGGISELVVNNPLDNDGYEQKIAELLQIFGRSGGVQGDITLKLDPTTIDWAQGDDYYTGQYAYITNPSSAVTNLFEILAYSFNTTTGNAEIKVGAEISNPSRGNVEGATAANPVVITSTAHGLVDGQPIRFADVAGMTQLNYVSVLNAAGNTYYVKLVDEDSFELYTTGVMNNDGITFAVGNTTLDGSAFSAWTSGGTYNADKDLIVAGVLTNGLVKIFPKINIMGDGVGAVAIPTVVNGRITSAVLLNRGSGYRNALATVVDPAVGFGEVTDVVATLRVILEPPGGHAYNLFEEFECKHFSFYGYITAADNTNIGGTNTYGAIGIVRSPTFRDGPEASTPGPAWRNGSVLGLKPDVFDNRIAIVTDDYVSLTSNSTVTQIDVDNNITFQAQVHEIDSTSNTVYLAEYLGPYQNRKIIGNGDTSFNPDSDITSDTGQKIAINNPVASNVTYSDYIQRTGEVYFMEDFFPLARTELSREEFKFVLEF
jgi:hypothetical protein